MSRRHLLTALLFGALLLSVATLYALNARAQEPQAQLQADVSYARIVRLSYVEGDVQVWRPEEEGWEQALLNLPLQQGYALATNQGRAEIEFESGATARMAENTILRFSKMFLSDGNRITELTLQQGSAIFYANLAKNDQFLVRTQHLSVLVPSNARFRVDATPAGAWVTVHKGDVTVETAENSYRVTKNRTLHFAALDERVEIARAESQDAFDRWAADREDVILAGRDRSTRYVNTQGYGYGVSDLSSYGGWYNVSGYGYGWRPYGVTLSWMPYMHGTWRYILGYGWTWVSYEPWGWLPYHYGNWVYSPAYGWLWIPSNFNRWCGARVFYVWHNNRMHWGPLNPHDRPGVRPHNLPHGTVTTGIPAGY
ncbi:MAG TPA: FecR family protein, partial [Candidatus Nitrosotenuis sp.]|nr:FecR family protein [Candidatus Nitrosotenuis sp.]